MPRKAPPDHELELFRERLESAMQALGVTRSELGERLGGKSGQYVSQLLTGATTPSRKRIAQIELALGVSVGALTAAPTADADGLHATQKVLLPDLAAWRSQLDSALRLRAAGHLAAAHGVVDSLVGGVPVPPVPGGPLDLLRAEALLLRSELNRCLWSSELAIADAKAARETASHVRASQPDLFARAYFLHIIYTEWAHGRRALVDVLTDTFPDGLGPETAFVPLVAEAIAGPDGDLLPDTAEQLAHAMEPAPLGPEKEAAFLTLESRTADGARYGAQWLAEARASGDPVRMAEALHHAAQRKFKHPPRLPAYDKLRESLELAVLCGYQHGVEGSCDVWAQVLRPPVVEGILSEGVSLSQFAEQVIEPALRVLREVAADERWVEICRAYALAGLMQGLALIGRADEAHAAAEAFALHEGRTLGSGTIAIFLACAASALERSAGQSQAETVWRLAEAAVEQAIASTVAYGNLPHAALEMAEAGREPELVLRALERATGNTPADAWVWALHARGLHATGRPLQALAAAERSWQLLRFLPPEQSHMPVQFYRMPASREERLEAARREALAWICPVFEAAATIPELSPGRRAAAAEAAEAARAPGLRA